jgi:hypothetical protein
MMATAPPPNETATAAPMAAQRVRINPLVIILPMPSWTAVAVTRGGY